MKTRTWYLVEKDFPQHSYCAPGMVLDNEHLALAEILMALAITEMDKRMGGYRITAPIGDGGAPINLRGHKVLANGKITHVLREMPGFLPDLVIPPKISAT